ncbi:MAG: methyltransferase domain-containing protein [Bdellovibrionales bacterium]|nr:methyltransferase domain-containing protein [Bdellovibrionales bacterium]
MPKLSTIPTIIIENILKEPFRREPEPDLIMDDPEQVLSFRDAGRHEGALDALYIYHTSIASKVIQGCKKVLDLGCGPGIPLIKMARLNPHIQFTGVDLSDPMLQLARDQVQTRGLKNIEFRKCDMTDLSEFKDHSFDGVTSLQAFHHLPTFGHLEQTFQEIQRVLKPEGALYLQDLIRLKSRHSTIHFAYYDPEAPYLTQLDGERSMRAAFSFDDYKLLRETYLPLRSELTKTAFAGIYFVLKTESHSLPKDVQDRIEAMRNSLRPNSKKYFKDIALFHRLGGLQC